MCGIAGWLGHLPDSESYAARLAKVLHHRGPDAHGIQIWPEATLIHTRLSIIDLSPGGAQPMANEDGTIWVVFNGEIYNHRELRRDLEACGHIFKGRSDTEVIVHLYEEKGLAFLDRLRGMFAIAIYNTHTDTLLLARDRFGIKPLFYAPGANRLAFASEIRALRELPGINVQPDRQAISDFAALFYIPAPETFFVGIRALQPGEVLVARLDNHRISWDIQNYHQWSIAPDLELSLEQAKTQADSLIGRAVRQQLESDVPLGSLLSGGIDSSLVSVAAQEALNGRLQTFNAQFSEEEYDETWAAVAVGQHIGSHHRTLKVGNSKGTWEHITDLLLHAGQPFADTSIFAANAVCRLMREHVTVALSGDGGDEGFGGYGHFLRIGEIIGFQRFPPWLWGIAGAIAHPLARLGVLRNSFPERIRDLTGADDTRILQTLFCWIREDEHKNLCLDTNLLPVRRLFEPQWEHRLAGKVSRLERLSAHATEVDARLRLPNDFLFKVDMASMKESLEVRVPLLDEELFAFGLCLPHHLKVSGGMCKKVLRAVAESKLPKAVAKKPKLGFVIPMDKWVDREFKSQLSEVLLGPSSRLPEFFRPETYRPVVDAFCMGRPHQAISRAGLYQRAIMLLAVQLALSDR
ncbi:asparagine synthase (glutamine-hydrolyzing) [Candidatus Nitrospira allomarina]|uniref:asparagine synthase (glutamine-hydrolyzing) n=1 Tax=Candidatus Nitrospira allomarina TaxID=3020900 RepID=A0AA96GAU0_9BACT|nr:asparagine synthase (glutamine-hydrolyzing) [Candidatus Nitrospira allomarina]WNM58131.1 asparagine synthase (glutamine-hydrolyzing) [Candidatus Nitrospira allomarina]